MTRCGDFFSSAYAGHGASGDFISAFCQNVRPYGFAYYGSFHDASYKFKTSFFRNIRPAQKGKKRVFPVVEQTGAESAVRGQAESVACRAEMTGKRGDQTETPPGSEDRIHGSRTVQCGIVDRRTQFDKLSGRFKNFPGGPVCRIAP